MIKTVSKNERITTITLDGTECSVIFFTEFNIFEVKNNSSGDVLLALENGKQIGDDGTVVIPAGESFNYIHMRRLRSCYLTGTGEVTVIAKNNAEASFKRTQKGGGESKQLGIYPVDETGIPVGDIAVPDNVVNLNYKFSYNTEITSVHLSNGIQTLPANCFRGCSKLESINLPDSLIEIGSSSFEGCRSLINVIPSEKAYYILRENCFYGCKALTNESVNNIMKHCKTWYPGIFKDCDGLTDVEVPGVWNNMFQYCDNLIKVRDLTSGNSTGNYVFADCPKLQEVYLAEGYKKIGQYVFQNCHALKIVYLPSSIIEAEGNSLVDSYYIFSGCTSLEDVRFGQNWNMSLRLDISEKITHDSMIAMFNNLKDLTGETAKTFTLGGVNLAKLSDEEKAIATNKNWILA